MKQTLRAYREEGEEGLFWITISFKTDILKWLWPFSLLGKPLLFLCEKTCVHVEGRFFLSSKKIFYCLILVHHEFNRNLQRQVPKIIIFSQVYKSPKLVYLKGPKNYNSSILFLIMLMFWRKCFKYYRYGTS